MPSELWSLVSERRLAIFLIDAGTGKPLPGVRVHASVEFGPDPRVQIIDYTGLTAPLPTRIPLGSLCTDHLGFASFDLERLNAPAAWNQVDLPPTLNSISVEIDQADGTAKAVDALVAGTGVGSGEAIVLRQALDAPACTQRGCTGTSIQNPSLLDWRLSPGSFAVNPAMLVGSGGCEALTPSNIATREFQARQLVRIKGADGKVTPYVDEYRITWYPIGHGLGDVAYTLPLAPGESVNLAFIDWTREDEAFRGEDTSVTEQLQHNLHRDRVIEETMNASLSEWQRGGSVMGGAAGSYGKAGMGASAALGGGYTTSSGDRDLNANTTQTLTDLVSQTGTSARRLASTIIVQSTQKESEAIKTRVVVNHNHCHALTIVYYEILRHYRVEARWTARRPVLLVKQKIIHFNAQNALQHRMAIEANLLDERLQPCIAVLQELADAAVDFVPSDQELEPPAEYELSSFEVIVRTGASDVREEGHVYVIRRMGISDAQRRVDCTPDPIFSIGGGHAGLQEAFTLTPKARVLWNDVGAIRFGASSAGRNGNWAIEHLTIKTKHDDLVWRMWDGPLPQKANQVSGFMDIPIVPFGTKRLATPRDTLSNSSRVCLDRLLTHLNQNNVHYSRAIWLAEDPDARAIRLTRERINGQAVRDLIENSPLGVVGDRMVFPTAGAMKPVYDYPYGSTPATVLSSKLVSIPARGVFAEARLGTCNACEVIDNTRFWDWQTSPIPEGATEILPIDPNRDRYKEPPDTKASNLPAPVVNIVNPPAAPDPTGLAAALTLLGTPNIFRDMSASAEVGALLRSLVAASSAAATAGTAKPSGGVTPTSGGAGSGGAPRIAGAAPTPAQQLDQLQVLRNAAAAGDLTRQQQQQMAQEYLEQSLTSQFSGSGAAEGITSSYSTEYDPDGLVVQEGTEGGFSSIRITPTDDLGDAVHFHNWLTSASEFRKSGVYNVTLPFKPRPWGQNNKPLKQIVIHETVSFRGMTNPVVQFAIEHDGTIFQLADLQSRGDHASNGIVNEQSAGIENVNVPFDFDTDGDAPNYPKAGDPIETIKEPEPIRTRVPIKWDKDRPFLVVPPLRQLEKLVVLVRMIMKNSIYGDLNALNGPQGQVPPTFLNIIEMVNTDKSGKQGPSRTYFVCKANGLATSLGTRATEKRFQQPGLISHSAVAEHVDGAFQTLYLWLRLEKQLAPREALKAAISIIAGPVRKIAEGDSDEKLNASAIMVEADVHAALTAVFPPPGTVLREF